MNKNKKYYQRLVADIASKTPNLDWDQRLGYIKEAIENDRSNKDKSE